MEQPEGAELFPVGDFLSEELEERGWSQAQFAEILGRPAQVVSEIITGKKEITRESAAQIGAALGTSPELWLNLQNSYLLWKHAQNPATSRALSNVQKRAELNDLAPVTLLRKRGFLTAIDLDDQLAEVHALLAASPGQDIAARRSNAAESLSPLQNAWLACVGTIAAERTVAPYSRSGLIELAGTLSTRAQTPESLDSLPRDFAAVGVALVYVESFPGGRFDGCAFIAENTPVIGLSGRGKRLDRVLFTLLHEVAHVTLAHVSSDGGAVIDSSEDSPTAHGDEHSEAAADELASTWLFPGDLPSVPARPTRAWLQTEADTRGVHPAVLLGQLQRRGALPWNSTLATGMPVAEPIVSHWNAQSAAHPAGERHSMEAGSD